VSFLSEDMVMRVRLKHERNSPRERAAEERRTAQHDKRRKRSMRQVRRMKAARDASRKGGKPKRKRVTGKFAKQLEATKMQAKRAKMASRKIPLIGWALIVNDQALNFHENARRVLDGMSARLVQARDDHTVYGDMIPQAASAAAALEYVESDAGRLRAIGNEGKMTGTLTSNVEIIRRLAYESAVGAVMILRDSHFDSADSFLDKIIMKAERAELKSMADRTCHLIRQRGGRGIK
jgi:hypothetical protein